MAPLPRFRVGSVPYVNALPLVMHFADLGGESPVDVVFDVPSKLPALLNEGMVDAILVSSYEGLSRPGLKMAAGVVIGSNGPVESVRLFSRLPFSQIESLALDQSSMTSNRLAQLLLKSHGVTPTCTTMPPDLSKMLNHADACVLIGDIGMVTQADEFHIMDLGLEWTNQTQLPFVWAGWMGRDGLVPELAALLQEALLWSGCGKGGNQTPATNHVINAAASKPGWTHTMAEHYLTQTMVYAAGDVEMAGLREYGHRLTAAGFSDAIHFPTLVHG